MDQPLLRLAAALLISLPVSALAQDKAASGAASAGAATPDPPVAEAPADAAKPADGAAPTDDASKKHAAQDKFGTDEEEEKAGKVKEEKKSRYYLGARFRDFIIPGFIFDWFADGGPDAVNVFSGGPEFALQSGALEVIFAVTVPYADFSMNEFMFKDRQDPKQAYEIVSSSLKLLTISVDLLGRIELEKTGMVALLIGGGAGISGVLGDIRRNQAYPVNFDDPDPDVAKKWKKCANSDDPNGVAPDGTDYCDLDNDHYGSYVEPSWVNGGSKPVVFPYLALPHIAVEILPIEQFMIRVDTGFSITGFFVGLAAGGKLPI